MLSDRHHKLLTAYVDGELDAQGRQTVDQLLESDPEARDFLDKLQADSKELQGLPIRPAPSTLADVVMETVNDNAPLPRLETAASPTPLAPAPTTLPSFPRWLGLSVAACVLALAAVATFFLASRLLTAKPEAKSEVVHTSDPLLDNVFGGAAKGFGDKVSDADIGMRLVLAEMHEEPIKQRLVSELNKQPGFWFDLPGKNNKVTVELLKKAFLEEAGMVVKVDQRAVGKLGNPNQAKLQYVLYAENLSRDEVANILLNVARTERLWQSGKLPAGAIFVAPVLMTRAEQMLQQGNALGADNLERVLMKAMHAEDRTLLQKLLRVDLESLKPSEKGLDLQLPIQDSNGQNQKKVAAKKSSPRLGVLLPMANGAAWADSDQLREFRSSRQGLRQGTLQLVLFIHERQN